MNLENPPVIQTWIGFAFEPSPQKRAWDFNIARDFLLRYRDSFTHIEAIFEETVQIQELTPTRQEIVERKVGLNRIRARDEGATRWLQLSDDRLVFNLTSGGSEYPGYGHLRDEALAKLVDYVEHFRSQEVRHTELHYVDLIEIPKPPGGRLEIKDYFRLRLELPEVFGPTWDFSFRVLLRADAPEDILEVRIRSELASPETEVYRFRTDWHMMCSNVATNDIDIIRHRLDAAHNCLLKYFRASVTDETWALFRPSEEG